MTFHWPQLLWLLLVPLCLTVLELRRRRAQAEHLTHPKILRAEAGMHHLELSTPARAQETAGASPRVRWRLSLGIALLVLALARPQWGHLDEPVFDQAREIMIALDLSRSMLAPDVRPSRLDRARLLVTSLLERLAGERVGLIVFSGTAFLQSPLSSDYEILNEFLPSLNPDYLPEGGTNYHALIDTALTAFGTSSGADRFLIILSDGEATDENWRTAVPELKAKGVRVIGLGVGTAQGSILPDGKGGFIKDERGAVVMSKLEPATLQELATLTGGVYVDASSWVDVAQIIQSTVEMGRQGKFREERHARFVERFQWALAPALLLLLWSFYSDFPVHPRHRDIKLRRAGPGAVPSPKRTAVEATVGAFLLGLLLTAGSRARAEDTPTNTAAEPLSKLVGQFAARDTLAAHDYAELAQTTLTYGQRQQTGQQPVLEGPVHDGLAAIDAGAALDPHAADWAKLRQGLEKLLEKPEPPPDQKKDQQDKQDQKKKDQQEKDQKEKEQKESKQQKDSEQKQQKSDSSSNPSQDKEGNQKDRQDQEKQDASKGSEGKDASPKPDEKDPQSAFGKMDKKPPEDPNKKDQNVPQPDTQKVGGNPDQKANTAPADPNMVVPLQRLQQLKNQDSPVRLEQMIRGNQPAPPTTGKNW